VKGRFSDQASLTGIAVAELENWYGNGFDFEMTQGRNRQTVSLNHLRK
jgi:hypothetical protein